MNQIANAFAHLVQVKEELELNLGKYSALLLGQLIQGEFQHRFLAAVLKEESEENEVNIPM